jgi:hypothetical protein
MRRYKKELNSKKLFTRYCKRCGRLCKTPSHSYRAVCDYCNAGRGRIIRVRKKVYASVEKDVKKYSEGGLILSPDIVIEAYQKVINKFHLNKELKRILHYGKNN